MTIPRFSIHALMAIVVVVALDCMIVRAVSARPEFLVENLSWLLFLALPMAHLLAVGAALLARGPIRARPFLVGFVIGGGLAILVTNLIRDRIIAGVESSAESLGAEAWLRSLPESIMIIVAYSIVVTVFLTIQLLAALIGGWLVRRVVAPREAEALLRPRLVPPMVAVLFLAIPALTIVGYLRWVVDPQELRRSPGTEAVVDLTRPMQLPPVLPKGSPLVALQGANVRIEQDSYPCEIELVAYSNAPRTRIHINDYRIIRVTLLDGERAGEAASVPHCFLRPIR